LLRAYASLEDFPARPFLTRFTETAEAVYVAGLRAARAPGDTTGGVLVLGFDHGFHCFQLVWKVRERLPEDCVGGREFEVALVGAGKFSLDTAGVLRWLSPGDLTEHTACSEPLQAPWPWLLELSVKLRPPGGLGLDGDRLRQALIRSQDVNA